VEPVVKMYVEITTLKACLPCLRQVNRQAGLWDSSSYLSNNIYKKYLINGYNSLKIENKNLLPKY